MFIYRLLVMIAVLAPGIAKAQSEFGTFDGTRVPGAVIECATNSPTLAVPCGIVGAPLKVDQGSAASLPPAGGSGAIGFLAGIYNTLSAGVTVGGSVSVANLPTTQSVSGSVAVSNLPAVQQVAGTVAANDAGSAITGAVLPAGGIGLTGWLSAIWSKLSGTLSVSVANLPITQVVSGSVTVGNLPSVQPVSGSVTATPPTASVSDCSVSLAVAGTPYQVIASGNSRKSILMQNLGSLSAGFSLTNSSPAIGALGTFTLLPNASVLLAPGMITSNTLYAVGSEAAQPLACTLFQ